MPSNGLQVNKSQRDLMDKHLQLVVKANEKVNLTRIKNDEEGRLLHIDDSLSALPELMESPLGLYGDLGSGGGYPGIPLAIASGRKTVLIDARMRKMEVMEEIVDELGLSGQISVFKGRAELLARKQPESFSVLTARALAKLSVLLELASPLLKNNGCLICYKSHVEDEEFNEATRVASLVGMELTSDRSFILGNDYERRILVYQKKQKAKVKLPRVEGMAQKNPL